MLWAWHAVDVNTCSEHVTWHLRAGSGFTSSTCLSWDVNMIVRGLWIWLFVSLQGHYVKCVLACATSNSASLFRPSAFLSLPSLSLFSFLSLSLSLPLPLSLRIIHENGFTRDECKQYRPVVYSNTIQSLAAVIRGMDLLGLNFADPARRVSCHLPLLINWTLVDMYDTL